MSRLSLRRATLSLSFLSTSICVLAGALPAYAQVAVQGFYVGSQPRDLVYNGAALRPIIEAAKTRRIDIAGIGDSNQVAGPGSDYGWDHGYSKAWSDRYGWYGTGVQGMNATGGWNGPQGYIDGWGSPYGASATGAPAELDKYKLHFDALADGINDFPPSYAYYGPSFVEPTDHWQPTSTIRGNSPLWGKNLRWNLTYGTFDAGAGRFQPTAISQGNELAQGPFVQPSTGTTGLANVALSLPLSSYTGRTDVNFGISYVGEGAVRGPFFGLWQRVDSEDTKGVSYSTMLWQGGGALVNAATALNTQSDDALREYVRNVVKLQNGDPMLLVNINHGGNDGGQTIPSVGPNPRSSDSPAGFADNMDAIIIRLRGIWISMGYNPANLVFEFGPYSPADGYTSENSGVTRVQRLGNWERAVINLSKLHPEYNLAVVRGSRLTTPLTMAKDGWYDQDGQAHLSIDGYVGFSELAVRQAIGYANPDAIQNRSNVTSLSFTFNSDISASLSPDDLVLHGVDNDTYVNPLDLAVVWDIATKTATWTFQGLPLGELPAGNYEATILASQFGAALEIAGDTGGDVTFSFFASPIPEPATTVVIGLVGLAVMRRRRA